MGQKEVGLMRVCLSTIVTVLLIATLSGCASRSCYNDNQICCTEPWLVFDAPPVCKVYDPIIKQMTPIDESTGEITTCSNTETECTVYLFEKTQCYVCQTQYTDSMGNT